MNPLNNKSDQSKKQLKKLPRSREDLIHFTSLDKNTDSSVKGEFEIDSKALNTTEKFIRQLQNVKGLPKNVVSDLDKIGNRINIDNNDIVTQHKNTINALGRATVSDNGNFYWNAYNENMDFEKNNVNEAMKNRDNSLEDEKNMTEAYLNKIKQNVTPKTKENIDYIQDRANRRFSNIKKEFMNEKRRLHGNSATEGNLRPIIMEYGNNTNDLRPDIIKSKERSIADTTNDTLDKKKAIKLKNNTDNLNNSITHINPNMLDAMRMPGY